MTEEVEEVLLPRLAERETVERDIVLNAVEAGPVRRKGVRVDMTLDLGGAWIDPVRGELAEFARPRSPYPSASTSRARSSAQLPYVALLDGDAAFSSPSGEASPTAARTESTSNSVESGGS